MMAGLEGCGNHSCYIKKPSGQGTNGPCMCRPSMLAWFFRAALAEKDAKIEDYCRHVAVVDGIAKEALERTGRSPDIPTPVAICIGALEADLGFALRAAEKTEAKRAALREVLEKIRARTCVMGTDCGDSAVCTLAEDALATDAGKGG